MRAEGRDPLACPAVAMACQQAVSVEDAGNQIVGGNEHQLAHRGDGLGSGAVALTPAPLRQAKLCMRTADPVDQQNDLGGCVVEIGNHLGRSTVVLGASGAEVAVILGESELASETATVKPLRRPGAQRQVPWTQLEEVVAHIQLGSEESDGAGTLA